jgi:hypothetical protein
MRGVMFWTGSQDAQDGLWFSAGRVWRVAGRGCPVASHPGMVRVLTDPCRNPNEGHWIGNVQDGQVAGGAHLDSAPFENGNGAAMSSSPSCS